MLLKDVKWDIFTVEEKGYIEMLASAGTPELIPGAIAMDSLEKEYWVSKILEEFKPAAAPLESKVIAEIQDREMHGKQIESPEEEAELQEKLEAERKEHKEKVKSRRKKETESIKAE